MMGNLQQVDKTLTTDFIYIYISINTYMYKTVEIWPAVALSSTISIKRLALMTTAAPACWDDTSVLTHAVTTLSHRNHVTVTL